MTVAALLDLGADCDAFWAELKSIPLPADEWHCHVETVMRHGIKAQKFNVHFHEHGESHTHEHSEDDDHSDDHAHPGRHLPEIISLIEESKMSDTAKTNAKQCFQHLAEAEASVHNSTPDEIHFHEVGAVDAIVDICGAAIGMAILEVDRVVSAAPLLGSGTVKCAHGIMPVPVPAVCKLLEGVPSKAGEFKTEMTTPTGAAILKTYVDEFEAAVSGKILSSGFGAGTKDFENHANVLSVVLYESDEQDVADSVLVIETNIDDMSGELLAHACGKLLELGALDYTILPCTMKKGRPGQLLSVIVRHEDFTVISDYLLRFTTTFGLRYQTWQRKILKREIIQVETEYGPVDCKVAYDEEGEEIKRSAEYESCRKLADENGIDISILYTAVQNRKS